MQLLLVLNYRYDRTLFVYPKKRRDETITAHAQKCKNVKEGRLFFKYKLLQRKGVTEGIPEIMKELYDSKSKTEFTDRELTHLQHQLKALIMSQEEPVKTFLVRFLKKDDMPPKTYQASLDVLLQLSGDSSLSASFSVPYLDHLLSICDSMDMGYPFPKLLAKLDLYSPKVKILIQSCVEENCTHLIGSFLRYLIRRVQAIFDRDSSDQAQEILGSHNPPSGTCYYFTQSGNQVRQAPNYNIKLEGKGKFVYDQRPEVDGVCTKDYPYQSLGGFGYMAFFFCPLHGHCYGFHLIDGQEGRKDVFNALYKYKPTAPKEMFYDFACQLNEFCLNREPEYFKLTRFFHDLFHGYPHKCGDCFRADKIMGLGGLDTEICEQFNSYLGCIKFTGSHLSQEHMMLLTQFMVCLWNREKTKKQQNVANVGLAGME
mgnify:FL=1